MIKILNTVFVALVLCVSVHSQAQVVSNGTGGGDFSTGSTWTGGTPPASGDLYIVDTGDTVTATGVTDSSRQRDVVRGTLEVNTGSELLVDRLNNGDSTTTGVVNINDGGILDIIRFTGAGITINVNNGGAFVSSSLLNGGFTLNINTGGTASLSHLLGTHNISGGELVLAANYGSPASWNTGTLVTNSNRAATTATEMGNFLTALNTHSANVLQISNQASAQTFSVGRTNQNLTFDATEGIFEFRVYSSANNDSDLMRSVIPDLSTTTDLSLTSDVDLRLLSAGPLPGTAANYLGSTYQLFLDNTGTYADITPTLQAVTWDIGGTEYEVDFINNLSTDGTLTVNNLTVIPEPGTLMLLGISFTVLLLCRQKNH